MFARPPATSESERDAELVRRTLAGERHAFETLVLLHTPRLRAIARNVVGESAAVDDVVQECFLRAYDRLGQLGDPLRFPGWISIICRNEAVSWLRRTSRLQSIEHLPDTIAPDEHRTEHPQLAGLQQALPRLSASYREILALKYQAGLEYEQIAQTLGTSVGNVEKRLYRARQALLALMPTTVEEHLPIIVEGLEAPRGRLKPEHGRESPGLTTPR